MAYTLKILLNYNNMKFSGFTPGAAKVWTDFCCTQHRCKVMDGKNQSRRMDGDAAPRVNPPHPVKYTTLLKK